MTTELEKLPPRTDPGYWLAYSQRTGSEDANQIALFGWFADNQAAYPQVKSMFHIPNGGSRHFVEAVKLKGMGVKQGVPDIFLPHPRGAFHGMFIEMKRKKKGVKSKEQDYWLTGLQYEGYYCVVCKGFEEAKQAIIKYLSL